MAFSKTKIWAFFLALLLIGWFLYPRELFLGYVYEGDSDLHKAEQYYLGHLQADPFDKFASIRLASLYERSGEPDRATPVLQKVYQHRPNDWDLAKKYLDHLEGIKDEPALHAARLEVFDNFKDEPRFPKWHLAELLEAVYFYERWTQDYEGAYTHLLALLAYTKEPEVFWEDLAQLDYGLKKTSQLQARLSATLKNNPEDILSRNELIGILFLTKQYAEALGYIEQGRRLHPEHIEFLERHYQYHRLNNNIDGMMATLPALIIHPQTTERLEYTSTLAGLYLKTGKNHEGILMMRGVLAEDKSKPDYWLNLIYAYDELKRVDEAMTLVEVYLQHFPEDNERRKYLAQNYLYLKKDITKLDFYRDFIKRFTDEVFELDVGYLLWDKQQRGSARDWMEAVSQRRPNDIKVIKFLADIYVELKKFPKALALLKKLISHDPNNPVFLETLAYIYTSLNQYDEALIYYKRVLQLSGLDYLKTKSIYKSVYFLGFTEKAKEYFELAHARYPQDAEVSYYLFEIYRALHQPTKAEEFAVLTRDLIGRNENPNDFFRRIELKVRGAIGFNEAIILAYETALKNYPKDDELYFDFVDLLLEHREISKAKLKLDLAAQLFPKDKVRLDHYRARYFMVAQQWRLAENLLNRLLEADPKNWALLSERAETYRGMGAWDLAEQDLQFLSAQTSGLFDSKARLRELYHNYDDRVTVGQQYVDYGSDTVMQWSVNYKKYLSRYLRLELSNSVARFQRPTDNLDELDGFGTIKLTRVIDSVWDLGLGLGYGFSDLRKTVFPTLDLDYRPLDTLSLALSAKYRALRTDVPEAIAEGALNDSAELSVTYLAKTWVEIFGNYQFTRTTLKTGESSTHHQIEPGLRFKIWQNPQLSLQYHFTYANLDASSAFLNSFSLADEIQAHYVTVSSSYRFNETSYVQVGGFVGQDFSRNLNLFRGELWGLQGSFDTSILRWLDLNLGYRFSKEIVTGISGQSHEVRAFLSGHW